MLSINGASPNLSRRPFAASNVSSFTTATIQPPYRRRSPFEILASMLGGCDLASGFPEGCLADWDAVTPEGLDLAITALAAFLRLRLARDLPVVDAISTVLSGDG